MKAYLYRAGWVAAWFTLGCSSAASPDAAEDASGVDLGEASLMPEAGAPEDAARALDDHFVMKVVSFTPGECAGFGQSALPWIVEGAPRGGGAAQGSLDVLSLGVGGEIVVSFEPNVIVNGQGADFIVFENVFFAGGDTSLPNAEVGEVSVSDDGVTWKTFPCTSTSAPFGACAGWHPTLSSIDNGISPRDPAVAGGDSFDLEEVGLASARYVRIRDVSGARCENGLKTAGFDLDAVAIVHAEH